MRWHKIDIVIPPVWTGVYLNTARLLRYALEELGIACSILEPQQRYESDMIIVLGWHLLPDGTRFNRPYIPYQLEPLALPLWQEKLLSKIHFFKAAAALWDYSGANNYFLKEQGISQTVVPLGYQPELHEISPLEFSDYDVLFTGFITERRAKILEALHQHCCVSVQTRWGKDFSEALGRSKIVLNIHQYDAPTPLEQPRIAYALNNGCFVLSEEASDAPYKHLPTCRYDQLVSETLRYLKDRNQRLEAGAKSHDGFKKLPMKELVANALSQLKGERLSV